MARHSRWRRSRRAPRIHRRPERTERHARSVPSMSAYTYAVERAQTRRSPLGPAMLRSIDRSASMLRISSTCRLVCTSGGVYDRSRAAWVPSPDGRIIKIVSTSAVCLSKRRSLRCVADSATLAIGTRARTSIVCRVYTAAKRSARSVTHFSPWTSISGGLGGRGIARWQTAQRRRQNPCPENGSIIECTTPAGEGSPHRRAVQSAYRSNRVRGYTVDSATIRVPARTCLAALLEST
jgi:hypothetical protein